jgi:hypothetical protein
MNVVAFAAVPEWADVIRESFEFLGINYTHEMPAVPPLGVSEAPKVPARRGKWMGRLWNKISLS